MDSDRLKALLGAACCVALAWVGGNVALDRVAYWAETEGEAHMWWSEEWLQLLEPQNFKGRGDDWIMLTGSSEGREGFLSEEMEEALSGADVYNNAYSNHTLSTFLLVLDYLESEYGPEALPGTLVVGVSPWFVLEDPTTRQSFFPRVINRYTPRVRMVVGGDAPRLEMKTIQSRMASRWRYTTKQSIRYRTGLLAVGVGVLDRWMPALVEGYDLRRPLRPSKFHHLPAMSRTQQLSDLQASPRSLADPSEQLDEVRMRFADLEARALRLGIDVLVVNMPHSTTMSDGYFGGTYELYLEALPGLVGDLPYLDLAGYLRDEEFYDLLHADREGARRLTERVARFIRETGAEQ